MNSLVKFFKQKKHPNGQNLYWHRAPEFSAPFRGNQSPDMTQNEAEEYLIRIADAKCGFFNIEDEEGQAKYVEIWDRICNGWYKLLYINRFYRRKPATHYLEWVEYYLEDGRTQVKPRMMEVRVTNGSEEFANEESRY